MGGWVGPRTGLDAVERGDYFAEIYCGNKFYLWLYSPCGP
jgi:hypothetical protein